jgi:hypothetical protein
MTMKSLALSLLVAVGVTLGAASAAHADAPRTESPSAVLANAQEASRQAAMHDQRAVEHRNAARVWSEKAKNALKIANDDAVQGFMYEAGVMREKAQQYQRSADTSVAAARREETTASIYRARAQAEMAHYNQIVTKIVVPKW